MHAAAWSEKNFTKRVALVKREVVCLRRESFGILESPACVLTWIIRTANQTRLACDRQTPLFFLLLDFYINYEFTLGLLILGKFAKAITMFNQIVKLNSSDVQALKGLSKAFLASGNIEQATQAMIR